MTTVISVIIILIIMAVWCYQSYKLGYYTGKNKAYEEAYDLELSKHNKITEQLTAAEEDYKKKHEEYIRKHGNFYKEV